MVQQCFRNGAEMVKNSEGPYRKLSRVARELDAASLPAIRTGRRGQQWCTNLARRLASPHAQAFLHECSARSGRVPIATDSNTLD